MLEYSIKRKTMRSPNAIFGPFVETTGASRINHRKMPPENGLQKAFA
jgi:hypothetical protein